MKSWPLISTVLLTALGLAGCGTPQSSSPGDPGSAAAQGRFGADSASFPFQFTVTDVTGKSLSLSDYQGKVVIVDIWGTWCGPCVSEIPSFIKLQQAYGSQGLQIIGLNHEEGTPEEARQTVLDFVAEHQINYPCALVTDEIMAQVPDFDGFPTTIFLDRNGQVQAKAVGARHYEALEKMVTALLEQ